MKVPLAMMLLALGVLCPFLGSPVQAQTQAQCSGVSGYSVVTGNEPGTLVASWDDDPSYTAFTLQYLSISDSNTRITRTVFREDVPFTISNLLNFTRYSVSVVPTCINSMAGSREEREAVTNVTFPSGTTTNVLEDVIISEDTSALVNISWPPIPEHQWNGIPLGYNVQLFRSPNGRVLQEHTVPFPDTYLVVLLQGGTYGIHVTAVNQLGPSPQFFSTEFELTTSTAAPGENDSFVNYPFFYILIPGVIFLAIIVGIIIVIFKKLCERNKGSISFARGIENVSPNYSKGFGNAMPMRELSPNSPNVSAGGQTSSAVASPSFMQPHNHHQHLANRPLPLSPDPALIPAEDVFVVPASAVATHPVSAHPSMNRKLTHPGPLPMLEENVEQAGFVPMSRTMTDPSLGSVFSPVSATSPFQLQHAQQQQQHVQQQQQRAQQQQQRGRSNTLPSPYEVPDQNMPHEGHSNGAYLNSATAPRPSRGATGGSNIPPPPAHSPPPLTNDLTHSHGFDDRHHSHQQQQPHPQQHHPSGMNSLPRTMGGHRSFSTSAAPGRSIGPIGPKGATHMRSDGNIHETMGGGDVPYYLPPVNSDEDPSIVSTGSHGATSSHGAGSESMAAHPQSLERGRRPPYSYHHKQRQPSRNPGMINGALASSDQLGNFGAGVGEGPIPPSYQLPPSRDRKRESLFSETSTEMSIDGDDKNKRESLYSESSGESASGNRGNNPARDRSRNGSVFSETSTELSGSSTNGKRHSPGWGGTKSDVGHRRQRSKSPPERETFSDVGFIHPQQSQNGFV